jgi:hypothetical protein
MFKNRDKQMTFIVRVTGWFLFILSVEIQSLVEGSQPV